MEKLPCKNCHGIGETTFISGQKPEGYSEENRECEYCEGTGVSKKEGEPLLGKCLGCGESSAYPYSNIACWDYPLCEKQINTLDK